MSATPTANERPRQTDQRHEEANLPTRATLQTSRNPRGHIHSTTRLRVRRAIDHCQNLYQASKTSTRSTDQHGVVCGTIAILSASATTIYIHKVSAPTIPCDHISALAYHGQEVVLAAACILPLTILCSEVKVAWAATIRWHLQVHDTILWVPEVLHETTAEEEDFPVGEDLAEEDLVGLVDDHRIHLGALGMATSFKRRHKGRYLDTTRHNE